MADRTDLTRDLNGRKMVVLSGIRAAKLIIKRSSVEGEVRIVAPLALQASMEVSTLDFSNETNTGTAQSGRVTAGNIVVTVNYGVAIRLMSGNVHIDRGENTTRASSSHSSNSAVITLWVPPGTHVILCKREIPLVEIDYGAVATRVTYEHN